MINEFKPASETDTLILQVDKKVSPGVLLREARLATGLHVAALAVTMKIPVKKLEALEADRFDLLTDAVFVRALASSVCRTLKIDAKPILALLPESVNPSFEFIKYKNLAKPVSNFNSGKNIFSHPSLKNIILVFILLIFIIFYNYEFNNSFVNKLNFSGTINDEVLHAINDKTVVPSIEINYPLENINQNIAITAANPDSSRKYIFDDKKYSNEADKNIFKIFAKDSSWVEVFDANKVILIRRMLAANETVTINGDFPLSVIIGKANVVEIEVRNVPFQIKNISKDNVARFEVN